MRMKLGEGELTISRARQMAAQNGFAFEANSPAELKQCLELMKRQLRDMETHREQYELALRDGFVIAGFGGNLQGIDVPETLMTGKVPAGMTPEQAFNEVIDFMRKTIKEASKALLDNPNKSASTLPKRPTKYLEIKKKYSTVKELLETETGVELYPKDGTLKATAITDKVVSSRTKNKLSDLKTVTSTENLKPVQLKQTKQVVKALKAKGKLTDISKDYDIEPRPDIQFKADGSALITPDNGKASFIIPDSELEKFQESEASVDPITAKILRKAIRTTKGRSSGELSIGDELQITLSRLRTTSTDPREYFVYENLCLNLEPGEVEALARSVDPKGVQELVAEVSGPEQNFETFLINIGCTFSKSDRGYTIQSNDIESAWDQVNTYIMENDLYMDTCEYEPVEGSFFVII